MAAVNVEAKVTRSGRFDDIEPLKLWLAMIEMCAVIGEGTAGTVGNQNNSQGTALTVLSAEARPPLLCIVD